MKVRVDVSLGELVDKISILKIKEKNIKDRVKLLEVVNELSLLTKELAGLKLAGIDDELASLIEVNSKLWNIEDEIRLKEKEGEFDEGYIQLARSVYLTNDQRFSLKNRINERYGSEVREVKSYEDY